ncbi:hypothetical protein J6590_045820 [Homalodisca vitripennis]|nr:hypothetical protein J6590_045820 [Homalodisca vitripennis]
MDVGNSRPHFLDTASIILELIACCSFQNLLLQSNFCVTLDLFGHFLLKCNIVTAQFCDKARTADKPTVRLFAPVTAAN